jgi:hypothetical protein
MQPMRRHVETAGLRPDVAYGVARCPSSGARNLTGLDGILRLAAEEENVALFGNGAALCGAEHGRSSAAASTAPSAGTGERGFVEQRERRAVRHTATNIYPLDFD